MMLKLLQNNLYDKANFDFHYRPTITILGIKFSFDDGLTRLQLEMNLYSCRYIQ
jgi:hypothetical protein